jgi:hypothetical protein
MNTYLTENCGYAFADIEAQSWEQAEELLQIYMKARLISPCYIVGELRCRIDQDTNRVEYLWGHEVEDEKLN